MRANPQTIFIAQLAKYSRNSPSSAMLVMIDFTS